MSLKWLARIIITSLVLMWLWLIYGCTASVSKANPDLFESPAVFLERVQQLKPNISEEEFYKVLRIEPSVENLEFMGPGEIWPYVYGYTQPLVPLEDLMSAKESIIAPFKGIRFPYSFIKKEIGLAKGPGITVHQDGYDLRVVAIFENGKLFRAPPEGTAKINRKDEIYIWDLVGDGLRGASQQGARESIKAIR